MTCAIVDQRKAHVLNRCAIQRHGPSRTRFRHHLHIDPIVRDAVSIAGAERRPIGRNAGLHCHAAALDAQPEQRLDDAAVEPARRARVPGPAAAADVRSSNRCRRPRHRVRSCSVATVGRRLRVVDRRQHVEQLPGASRVAQRARRPSRPDRGMRVLAAVLAHAGHIALDVAGIRVGVGRTADRAAGSAAASRPHQVLVPASSIARCARAGRPRRTAPTSSARSSRCGIPRWPAEPSGVPSSNQARRYHVAVPGVCFDGVAQRAASLSRQRSANACVAALAASVGELPRARRTGRRPATRSRPCPRRRPGSCRRSSRRSPSAAGRARRSAGRGRSRARSARRAWPDSADAVGRS